MCKPILEYMLINNNIIWQEMGVPNQKFSWLKERTFWRTLTAFCLVIFMTKLLVVLILVVQMHSELSNKRPSKDQVKMLQYTPGEYKYEEKIPIEHKANDQEKENSDNHLQVKKNETKQIEKSKGNKTKGTHKKSQKSNAKVTDKKPQKMNAKGTDRKVNKSVSTQIPPKTTPNNKSKGTNRNNNKEKGLVGDINGVSQRTTQLKSGLMTTPAIVLDILNSPAMQTTKRETALKTVKRKVISTNQVLVGEEKTTPPNSHGGYLNKRNIEMIPNWEVAQAKSFSGELPDDLLKFLQSIDLSRNDDLSKMNSDGNLQDTDRTETLEEYESSSFDSHGKNRKRKETGDQLDIYKPKSLLPIRKKDEIDAESITVQPITLSDLPSGQKQDLKSLDIKPIEEFDKEFDLTSKRTSTPSVEELVQKHIILPAVSSSISGPSTDMINPLKNSIEKMHETLQELNIEGPLSEADTAPNRTLTFIPSLIRLGVGDMASVLLRSRPPAVQNATMLFIYSSNEDEMELKPSINVQNTSNQGKVIHPLSPVSFSKGQEDALVPIIGLRVGVIDVGTVTSSDQYTNLRYTTLRVRVIHSTVIDVVAEVDGWLYFVMWGFALFPQIYLNWKNKSVVGLSFDYLLYSFVGYMSYTIFNICMLNVPVIENEYKRLHPKSSSPVQYNDVFMSMNLFLSNIIIFAQCKMYKSDNQKISKWAIGVTCLTGLYTVILGLLTSIDELSLLTFMYYFSYIKLGSVFIKYLPQVWMNHKRECTDGWSLGFVFCDAIGAAGSLLQMFLLAYNAEDLWMIKGNPTKLGLGFINLVFDAIFFYQYVSFRKSQKPQKVESSTSTPGSPIHGFLTDFHKININQSANYYPHILKNNEGTTNSYFRQYLLKKDALLSSHQHDNQANKQTGHSYHSRQIPECRMGLFDVANIIPFLSGKLDWNIGLKTEKMPLLENSGKVMPYSYHDSCVVKDHQLEHFLTSSSCNTNN